MTSDGRTSARDTFFASLSDLDAALDEVAYLLLESRARIHKLRKLQQEGRPLGDLRQCQGPSLVQILSDANACIDLAGAHVRRRAVAALQEEDFSINEIAEMFGVSRQRISTVIKEGETGETPATTMAAAKWRLRRRKP